MDMKQATILGYETHIAAMQKKLSELKGVLTGMSFARTKKTAAKPTVNGSRSLSPEGRKRIAAAQRKRWRAIKSRLTPASTGDVPVSTASEPQAAAAKPVKTRKRGRPRKTTQRKAASIAAVPAQQTHAA